MREPGKWTILVALTAAAVPAAWAQLPPPPVPTENPLTGAKRVLGKILFWDEQLSSDGTEYGAGAASGRTRLRQATCGR